MSGSAIDDTLAGYRAALIRREGAALAEIVRAYGAAYMRIDAELRGLLLALESVLAAGREAPISWLIRSEQLATVIRRIAAEWSGFADVAGVVITKEQAILARRGALHAEALMRVGMGDPPVGLAGLALNPVPDEVLVSLVGVLQDGSPLRSLFDAFGVDASLAARDALITGVTVGRNPRVIASELRRVLGTSLTRALTIARTEMLRPYRTAALEGYRRNPDVVKAWRWSARMGDKRTCGMCYAMHGTIHQMSEPFGSHPNCRCAPVPVTVSWAELGLSAIPDAPLPATGVDVFKGLPVAEQLAILGPGKLAAYQSGLMRLQDIVGARNDPMWGLVRYERSLKEILSGA